jgi:alkanesulfonate monooxygenase SsuD/methylene tetrahydromethanopterin reductase-like flavin-dependent oxidoreductase (luciferase family)
MPMAQRKKAYELYRQLAEEKYGYEARPEQLAFCVPVLVAETDELAMREAERYLMWLFDRGLKVRPEFNFPPGYVSERSFLGVLQSGALTRPRPTLKDLIDTGVVIVGGVDTVVEKLAYYTDVLHAGMLVTGGHVGETPDYLVLKNQELMAREVMPHFREHAADAPPPVGALASGEQAI